MRYPPLRKEGSDAPEGEPENRWGKDSIRSNQNPNLTESVVSLENSPSALGKLFWIWLMIGLQSFGGGLSTWALIRDAAVEKYGWATEEEFARDNALSRLTPGVTLFALPILLGKRVAGKAGICVSLLGLILPSAAVTILITAFYANIRGAHFVEKALHGVVPATVGIGLYSTFQMTTALMKRDWNQSKFRVGLSLLTLCFGGLAIVFWKIPVIATLLIGGFASALLHWFLAKRCAAEEAE